MGNFSDGDNTPDFQVCLNEAEGKPAVGEKALKQKAGRCSLNWEEQPAEQQVESRGWGAAWGHQWGLPHEGPDLIDSGYFYDRLGREVKNINFGSLNYWVGKEIHVVRAIRGLIFLDKNKEETSYPIFPHVSFTLENVSL